MVLWKRDRNDAVRGFFGASKTSSATPLLDHLAGIHDHHPVGDVAREAISCVTTIMVVPSVASCFMTSSTSPTSSGSSAEVPRRTA